MADRLPCCVPFCRRTTKDNRGFNEWLCSKHYGLVDQKLKALRRRALRRGRYELDELIWRRLKRQAIERAVGLQ